MTTHATVTAEACRRLYTDLEAWREQYADADELIESMLDPIVQRAIWHRYGLFPMSVLRRHLTDQTVQSLADENLSALLRSGSTDTGTDYAHNGSSAPLGDWERASCFYPGKHSGPRYVRAPWKLTLDEQDTRLLDYEAQVQAESDAAACAYQPPDGPQHGTTPIRAVRIPDHLWHALQAAAARDDTTVSDILRTLAVDYLTSTSPGIAA